VLAEKTAKKNSRAYFLPHPVYAYTDHFSGLRCIGLAVNLSDIHFELGAEIFGGQT